MKTHFIITLAAMAFLPAALVAQDSRDTFTITAFEEKFSLDPPLWSTVDDYQETSDIYINETKDTDWPSYQIVFLPKGSTLENVSEMYLFEVYKGGGINQAQYAAELDQIFSQDCAQHSVSEVGEFSPIKKMYLGFCSNTDVGEIRTMIYESSETSDVELIYSVYTEPYDVAKAKAGHFDGELSKSMATVTNFWQKHLVFQRLEASE